jgi:hypothetical protein
MGSTARPVQQHSQRVLREYAHVALRSSGGASRVADTPLRQRHFNRGLGQDAKSARYELALGIWWDLQEQLSEQGVGIGATAFVDAATP